MSKQCFNEVTADKTIGTGDEYFFTYKIQLIHRLKNELLTKQADDIVVNYNMQSWPDH